MSVARTRAASRPPKLTPEQWSLAAKYLPLARSLAKGLGDDAESGAVWGLIKAARRYREPSTVRFATYARRNIRWEIWLAMKPPRPLTMLPETYEKKRDVFLILARSPTRPDRLAEENESGADAEILLRKLPRKHADALRLTAIEGLDQQHAAERMGCSQSQVARLKAQAKDLVSCSC